MNTNVSGALHYRFWLAFALSAAVFFDAAAQNTCQDNYILIYNGRNSVSDQQLGVAFSIDGINFEKETDPILSFGTNGSYDDVHLAQPSIVVYDNLFYLYYSAWSGTKYTVGLATSTDALTWTKVGMVLDVGQPGMWDANLVYMPHVVYDEDAQQNERWKMWYLGSGSSGFQAGYATSADGQNWTKSNSNPVIPRGTGADWDVGGIISPTYYEQGDTSYIIYEGYNADFSQSNLGVAWFTEPHSVYTKSSLNPVLPNRNAAHQFLISNSGSGTYGVRVADAALFEVDEYVYLSDNNSTEVLNRVMSIDTDSTLTLYDALDDDFSVDQNASIISIYASKITPCSVVISSQNEATVYGTAYGSLPIQRELCVAYNFTEIQNDWSYDFERGVLGLPILDGPTTNWDYTSLENPAVIACSLTTDVIEEESSEKDISIEMSEDGLIVKNNDYSRYQISNIQGKMVAKGTFKPEEDLVLSNAAHHFGIYVLMIDTEKGDRLSTKFLVP